MLLINMGGKQGPKGQLKHPSVDLCVSLNEPKHSALPSRHIGRRVHESLVALCSGYLSPEPMLNKESRILGCWYPTLHR